MKFSLSTAVLSALAASQLASAGMHNRAAKHHHAARHAELAKLAGEKRENEHLHPRDVNALLSMGFKALGVNPSAFDAANPGPWIGTGGQYTNTIYNMANQDMVLVVWGPFASWVNAHQPQITLTIPANSSKTISFNNGMTGAYAPVYGNVDLTKSNGQIPETWVEYTFTDLYSTVDVSREVNMKGTNTRIVTPKCISDMTTCAFVCADGGDSCWLNYKLLNCDSTQPGQSGANSGWDPQWNAPSGGCSQIKVGDKLETFFGYKST